MQSGSGEQGRLNQKQAEAEQHQKLRKKVSWTFRGREGNCVEGDVLENMGWNYHC